jgi:hypothetical protein
MKKYIFLSIMIMVLFSASLSMANVCFLSSGGDTIMIKGRYQADPLVKQMCEIGRQHSWISTLFEWDDCNDLCQDLLMHTHPVYDISFNETGTCWVLPINHYWLANQNHIRNLFKDLKKPCNVWDERPIE